MNYKLHAKIFLITLYVFIAGIFVAELINRQKISIVKDEISGLKDMIQSTGIMMSVNDAAGKKVHCSFFESESESISMYSEELAQKMDRLSKSYIFPNRELENAKKDYFLSIINNWIYIEQVKKNCNSSMVTVLFFYNSSCKDECDMESFYLSYYRGRDPANVRILMIDKEVDVSIIKAITLDFNITKVPAVVINSEKTIQGYINATEVELELCAGFSGLSFC